MANLDERSGTCYMKKRYANAAAITAEMARERSDSSNKIKVEEELADVYEKIYDVSGKGEYSTIIHHIISDEAAKHLIELGFEIERVGVSHPMDEEFIPSSIRISWKKIIN